jgi:O-antigen/teichoic acid export membrane protein
MAVTVILMNKWLISLMGINGAALATFLVVFIFNTIKIGFISWKYKLQPFTMQSVKLTFITALFFLLLLKLNFNMNPFVSIIIKSTFIAITYFLIVYWLRISADFNGFVNNLIKKFL